MLRSERIVLAPLTRAELPVLFTWINDRSEVVYNAAYRPVDEARHEEWFAGLQKARDLVVFAIRRIEGDKLIGTCQLRGIDPVHRTADLQIRLGEPDERGCGYGTEAVRLLVSFAFNDLNLRRVGLQVFATNPRAIRCYEKAGFVREGTLRQAVHVDGRHVDVVLMGILREEHPGG